MGMGLGNDPPRPQTRDEFHLDLMRQAQTHPGEEITCRCCGRKYVRGDWDFHQLCTPCFNNYDIQKRTAIGDSTKYIASGRCTHDKIELTPLEQAKAMGLENFRIKDGFLVLKEEGICEKCGYDHDPKAECLK